MSASDQFLIVDVLSCAWHHIENVKEFFLSQHDEFRKLFGADFLGVGSCVVDELADHQLGLFCELFQLLRLSSFRQWECLSDCLRNVLILQALHVHSRALSWPSLE